MGVFSGQLFLLNGPNGPVAVLRRTDATGAQSDTPLVIKQPAGNFDPVAAFNLFSAIPNQALIRFSGEELFFPSHVIQVVQVL